MSNDCNSITGRWRYGSEGEWQESVGTRGECCKTCPDYDYGPFTPSYTPQTVSDSFTAGGCRWYLFHLIAEHDYCFSTCPGEGLCTANSTISFYNASSCQALQCSSHGCGICGDNCGYYFNFGCTVTGDYLIQVQEVGNDAALSYTLTYRDCSE